MVGLGRARVLVTRPRAQAEATASRTIALGLEPVVVPLRSVEMLPFALPDAQFEAIAATSANAFAGLPPDLVRRLSQVPVFCVGDRTASAARSAGFNHVETGGGTAGLLADLLVARGISPLLYLCGMPRRPDLEDRLAAFGRKVTALETYRMTDQRLTANERDILRSGLFDIALLYSAESASALADHLSDWSAERLAAKRFLCLSQAVADRLPPQAACAIAAEPSEDALLRLLESPD